MGNIKPFIVLSHQRSGTTHLCNHLLAKHPEIFCFDELFNQPNHNPTDNALKEHGLSSFYSLYYKVYGKLGSAIGRYEKYHQDFLKQINQTKQKDIIGFKLFDGQTPSPVQRKFISSEKNKIIFLTRQNIVQSAVSMYLLLFKNLRNHISKVEVKPYEIDIDWCEYWIVRNRYMMRQNKLFLEKSGKDFLEIKYEELGDKEVINKIYQYLGAKSLLELPEGMKKMATKDKYKKISNLSEFQKRLCNDVNGYLF